MVNLPHGGPLNVAPEVAEFFLEHIAAVCADSGTPAEHHAKARRDAALGAMTREQRATAAMLATGLKNQAERF